MNSKQRNLKSKEVDGKRDRTLNHSHESQEAYPLGYWSSSGGEKIGPYTRREIQKMDK